MFKKITFPNNARLLLIPYKDTKAVTVLFLFGVGSRYESKEVNGVSHFIEHLLFKGTKSRPTSLDISKELDSVGAEFNAMTSKDYTGYYVKINHENCELGIDILSDMILNSKFEPKEINRERGVVIEEIKMYEDNPVMYIETLLEQLIHKGNALERDISGPIKVIENISRQQIIDFKEKHYCLNNLVVAVAGKIDGKVTELIEKYFIQSSHRCARNHSGRFIKFKTNQKAPRVTLNFKETKQAQLALGFPCFGYDDADAYGLHLLSIILGGNMSSRLFTSVREKNGLAYFIRCYPNFYQDCGNIMVQSGLDNNRTEEALKIILNELRGVKKNGVTEKELKDAKEFMRGKIVLNLEDSSNLAEYFAKQEVLLGEVMTPEQKMEKYDAVAVKDIKRIANKIFQKSKFNLAIIGPFKSELKFLKAVKL